MGNAPPPSAAKWLIPDTEVMSTAERRDQWVAIHADYRNVLSLTEDQDIQNEVVRQLRALGARDVLLPGCGTRAILEKVVVEECDSVQRVVCTDYAEVLELIPTALRPDGVEYEARDSANLEFATEFDAVVAVNSVLSDSDRENRRIVASCAHSLRPGGCLIGFFPTVYCAVEIAYLEKNPRKLADIDLATSSCYERAQDSRQIFYTPLRLRRVLHEAGLTLRSMSIIFCDSVGLAAQARRLYQISDEDAAPWELLVVAARP